MTLQELDKEYYFHDSSITSIEYDKDKKTLHILLDFCFWMQEGFKEGEPENGEAKLTFANVSHYDGPVGILPSNQILALNIDDGTAVFAMEDQSRTHGNFDCFLITIKASDAGFEPI
jgi:hypothetical protein